jgi:transposase
MRQYYTGQHQFYCGVDLHAKTMYLCVVNQADETVLHREIRANADRFLRELAPYRASVVVCVECTFMWYWVADLCAAEGIPFVLGHALAMTAMQVGKIKNDRVDSRDIAKLLRAGMIPMSYVYPKAMRATRDLLRRRMQCVRQRAGLLTHIQQTTVQYNLAPLGTSLKSKGNREGVADHFEAGSVRLTVESDLAMIDAYDTCIHTIEQQVLASAKAHDATTLHLLRTIPGIGKILSLVILYEIHDIRRFPTSQKFCSYSRLIRPVKESAGKRVGVGNGKQGNAYLKWAFSEAVVLFLRETREAHPVIQRMERKYGKAKAKGVLAHRLGRTVYYMLKHQQVFDLKKFVNQ